MLNIVFLPHHTDLPLIFTLLQDLTGGQFVWLFRHCFIRMDALQEDLEILQTDLFRMERRALWPHGLVDSVNVGC